METDQDARIRELEAELARRDALLREIDHRVKNNLQLISSLMLLQSRRMEDGAARQALKVMLERVNAVAAVHRRLLQSEDAQTFEISALIRDMAGDLALAAGRDDVRITLDLTPVIIPSSMAAPFALVFNELLTNALKHAFPGDGGEIAISLAETPDACVLTVADDGCGMGDAKQAFGLTIVGLLCRQLHAHLEVMPSGRGVRATVQMPLSQA